MRFGLVTTWKDFVVSAFTFVLSILAIVRRLQLVESLDGSVEVLAKDGEY